MTGLQSIRWFVSRTVFAALVLLAASGLRAETEDPWEPANRKVFALNEWGDRWIAKPLARTYKRLPESVQRGLHNIFENLAVPRTAVNQVLQGRPHEGMVDVTRFAVNSTFGLLGWFDLATRSGLPKREEDFGQTFSVWGIGSGPFVMLPALGPSTVTDTAGTVLDFLFNPIELFESDATQYGLRAVDVIDTRAELMTVESVISGDRYLFMRDAYLQLRAFEVKNGEIDVEDDPFLDDFEDEEEY